MAAANDVAAYEAGRYKEEVSARLAAGGARMKPVRDSLVLVRYERGDSDVWAVIASVRRVPESEVDRELTAVTVLPRRPDAWLLLLQRTSPWPLTLLPARPRPGEADLVGRSLRQGEMEKLRAARIRSLGEVLPALRAYGIETGTGTREEAEIVIDTNWEAIRAEHGLGGFGRVPAWGPALDSVLRDRSGVVKVMEESLLRPKRPVAEAEAGAADVAALRGFMARF